MAIALGTSPPVATDPGNFGQALPETNSFTPPANSLLIAAVMAVGADDPEIDGGGLTWTSVVERFGASLWMATVGGSPSSMTVAAFIAGDFFAAGAIKVWVVTGFDAADPIGATGSGSATSNTLSIDGYTSTSSNSRGLMAAVENAGLGSPTVRLSDLGNPWNVVGEFGDASGIAIAKAANTSASGTAVPFQADAPGSSAADWDWVAAEIRPGGFGAEVTVELVAVSAAVPAPAASVSADRTPAPIAAVADVPTPAIEAGSTAHPSTIAASVAMPPPSVTTEETELAVPPTIAAAAQVPAPTVQVGSAPTLAAVLAEVSMPAPTVQVHADVTLDTVAVEVEMPLPMTTAPVLPGDRLERAGQIEWRGFLLGAGTPYSWQDLTGWRSTPPIISGNVDQPTASGSYPGQPFAAERIVNWSMLIKASRGQVGQALDDLEQATGVPQSEAEGYLVVWDLDDVQPQLVLAHLTNRDTGPLDRNARIGLLRGGLQWTASDPRRLSVLRASAPVPIDVETDLLNNGNDATAQEMRIHGPVVTPQIENRTTNRVVAFDVELAEGETLVIDVKNGTVAVGELDLLSKLIEGSVSVKDFVLAPGANRLLYTAESGGDLMDVLWRHANT